MSSEAISRISKKIVELCYGGLFFCAPLFFTPLNYELFEFNKMLLVYAFSVLVLGLWLIRSITEKRMIFRRTPFDIPFLFFLGSEIISAFFSIDRHTSIWGYYSRFNGGLLSVFAYLVLFYAFVSNFSSSEGKNVVRRVLKISLASGVLVAVFGFLEHFGLDADYWVQDVKNRVFSTLGQPNWLAAYLSILLLIAVSHLINKSLGEGSLIYITSQKSKVKNQKLNLKFKSPQIIVFAVYFFLPLLFYLVLLYTKSRSGFAGFWAGLAFFYLTAFYIFTARRAQNPLNLTNFITIVIKFVRCRKDLTMLLVVFLFLTFAVGAPFSFIPRMDPAILPGQNIQSTRQVGDNQDKNISTGTEVPALESGGTESGKIREIVWRGAINIWKRYPWFGSGVETFAYAYYRDRPEEHNLTSEWDFLYNKAHNEYLNYLSTTGVFGLTTYLLFIVSFVTWSLGKSKNQRAKIAGGAFDSFLLAALFSGWVTILVSNFFGFSVVITSLFFFLIPAFSLVLRGDLTEEKAAESRQMTGYRYLLILTVLFFIFNFEFLILKYWLADYHYAKGVSLGKSKMYLKSYEELLKAISLKNDEPNYHDEMANTLANIAVSLKEKEADLAQKSGLAAKAESDYAVRISPVNVSYYKTRAKVFYLLSFLEPENLAESVKALKTASELAPTDAKIKYNLALLYEQDGKRGPVIDELRKTTALKADYRDAWFALAVYLKENGQTEEAKSALNYILTRVLPNDREAVEKLKEWGK